MIRMKTQEVSKVNNIEHSPIIACEKAKNGEKLILTKLTLRDIEDIMKLQDKVSHALLNKETYVCSSKEEFEQVIQNNGLLGYKTEDQKLVALGAYMSHGHDPHNYGYDLEFNEDKLLAVGQIESTIVDPEYRGNGLQKKLCEVLEILAREEQKSYIMATVSPMNPYSLNNFLALGYINKKEKLKYGGLRRYILCKKLV